MSAKTPQNFFPLLGGTGGKGERRRGMGKELRMGKRTIIAVTRDVFLAQNAPNSLVSGMGGAVH